MNPISPIRSFNPPKRKLLFGMRKSALIEMIVMLATLLLLDWFFFDGVRYWSANPHPFWFVILLIACKYGTKEGLFAAILSGVALLAYNLPGQTLEQDSYAYALVVLKLPLLWLVSSVIFGELRQLHMRERDKLETALMASEERESTIAQSYQWVRQLKDHLELRMAGQLRSSISAYHAAKAMESLSPPEVIRGLEELVTTALHPEQFSIYTMNDGKLEIALMHGWRDNDPYLRQYAASHAIYQSVIGRQEVLCVANSDHERILGGHAMLVGPLLDRESGEVVGMLKIEKLGFTDLNLSNIEAFSTLCEWAGMAIVNARKYQLAKEGSIINPDHNLLTAGYFKRYSNYISALAERVGFDVAMLNIRMTGAEDLAADTRNQIARALSESVDSVLRNIDLAFDHQDNIGEYSIMLPATGKDGVQNVIEKIRTTLEKRVGKLSKKAAFAFATQMIYEKKR